MNTKYFYFLLFFGFTSIGSVFAQQSYPLKTSEMIKDIMIAKKEEIKRDKSFRIQIFNGNKESVDSLLDQVKQEEIVPFQLFFETPNYKVRSSGFRTRIEAEKYLLKIKEKYPGSFIVLS